MNEIYPYVDPLSRKTNPINGKEYSRKYYETNERHKGLPFKRKEVYEELSRKIVENDVLIVEGATGSGKSVVLPVLIQEIYGFKKHILISQPRTVNIRSSSEMYASQMDLEVGREIGYVYGADHAESENPNEILIYVITDYFLSRSFNKEPPTEEDPNDPGKRINKIPFDVYIIDEVHERKINGDIFLSLIKELYMKNKINGIPNTYKTILLSATINPEKFIQYFKDVVNVGHMKVEGVAKPLYRAFISNRERFEKTDKKKLENKIKEVVDDLLTNKFIEKHLAKCRDEKNYICELDSLERTGIKDSKKGDILVFVPGQVYMDDLLKMFKGDRYKDIFFANMARSVSEDERKYITKQGYVKDGYTRQIVFATNIAETGVTIEGIRFVIETGITQQVAVDPKDGKTYKKIVNIQQSNALQRCGRAGRREPGICIQLYTRESFAKDFDIESRPEIYDKSPHDIIRQIILFQGNIEDTLSTINGLIDPINQKQLDKALIDLYDFGILQKGKPSKLAYAIETIGIDWDLGLLIIEGFNQGIGEYMVPVVTMLKVMRTKPEDFIDPNRTDDYLDIFSNEYGDPVTLYKMYLYIRNEFIIPNIELIRKSHSHLGLYIIDEMTLEDQKYVITEVIYYLDKLKSWCKTNGFVFDLVRTFITELIKTEKKINKLGVGYIYFSESNKRMPTTNDKDLFYTIVYVFGLIYFKNIVIYIPDRKSYAIPGKYRYEYLRTPGSEFYDVFKLTPKMIGYRKAIYSIRAFPRYGSDPSISCVFRILEGEKY